jgi:alpha-N-acetylglucosaminidase
MKKICILLLACLLPVAMFADDVSTFKGLVGRLLPGYAASFVAKKLPAKGQDYFQLASQGDKVVIGGNDANSMAVGLNYYLKYYCHTTVSWFADDSFEMPASLPVISKPVTVNARCKDRFFLNYCTFGYTMPWWTWKDWEHFIDWMALNGVNMPLAITGQESIWHKVWMKLGLSDKVVRHYFTGPAHLPWHRMLNIDYWQGDLPMSWLDDQEKLQKEIVAREREFNMKPVLPAFAGHVPQELKQIYPKAKITKLGAWSGYSDQYACSFLDPMDPLFAKIQKMFLQQQKAIYGTDHIYGIDLFNELEPPSYEATYLRRVASQVYGTLQKVDKEAVWLQMTWLFYNEHDQWTNDRIKAYITAYPAKKSILLDYYCERHEVWQQTEKYYGVPYIWCYLGNFGGNTMLAGNIGEVNKRIENTFRNGGSNFEGLGSTLEGFDCNPFMYEYIFEKAWDFDTHKDVDKWAEHISDEHVGKADANARAAWDMLLHKIYAKACTPGQCPVINIRPAFGKFRTYYCNYHIGYANTDLLKATELMLKADSRRPAYAFDVVNLTRQVISNYYADVFKEYEKAYNDGNYKLMKAKENVMLQMLSDVDRLVSSQSAFLMGKWIEEARAKGVGEEEKLYYERNARNLLTTWGEKAGLLNDYASRTWSGLTSTFYGERWKMFFAAVDRAVIAGQKFDEAKYKEYEKEVTDYEEMWWKDCIGDFPSKPVGNGILLSKRLIAKYKTMIEQNK